RLRRYLRTDTTRFGPAVLGGPSSAGGRVRHQSQYERSLLLAAHRRLRLFVPMVAGAWTTRSSAWEGAERPWRVPYRHLRATPRGWARRRAFEGGPPGGRQHARATGGS